MQLVPTRSRPSRSPAARAARKAAKTVTKTAPETATAVWAYRRRIGVRRVLLAGGGVALVFFVVRKATSGPSAPEPDQPPAPVPDPGAPNEGAPGHHPVPDDASRTPPHGDATEA